MYFSRCDRVKNGGVAARSLAYRQLRALTQQGSCLYMHLQPSRITIPTFPLSCSILGRCSKQGDSTSLACLAEAVPGVVAGQAGQQRGSFLCLLPLPVLGSFCGRRRLVCSWMTWRKLITHILKQLCSQARKGHQLLQLHSWRRAGSCRARTFACDKTPKAVESVCHC